MAFIGNGITLTTKMLKELANGAVVLSLDGATNNVSIGVQYDDATIKVNENNQLIVGAIAISNVTDLQSTITGLNDRIEALEVGTVDLSNYVSDNGISIIGQDADQPTWGGGVKSGDNGAFTIGTFSNSESTWNAQTVIETSDGKVAFKQQESEYFVVTPTAATFNGNALVFFSVKFNGLHILIILAQVLCHNLKAVAVCQRKDNFRELRSAQNVLCGSGVKRIEAHGRK